MSSLYKRGSVWWCKFTRDGQRHRHSLRTGDRRVAEKRSAQLIADFDASGVGEQIHRPWADCWQRFWMEHFPTIKPSSAKRYAVSLKALSRVMDGKGIEQVSRSLLSEFEAMRKQDGVSPSSIRRDLICLSLILSYCEDWEWIAEGSNIVPAYLRRAGRRGLKEGRKRTRYLSVQEEADLIAACNPMMAVVVQLAIDSGLRDQEIMTLKWWQVDFERGTVETTTMTKSGRKRLVPLHPRSAAALKAHPRHITSQYVFCHPDGERFARLNKSFEGARRRAGLDGIRFHDLRRTAGCRWLQRDGAKLQEVSMWLGHSSIAVTEDRYAFLDAQVSAQKMARSQRLGDG